MFLDANLLFDPAGTAIASTAVSTNVLDLGANRDIGSGNLQGHIQVLVQSTFTAAAQTANVNVQLQGAPDNGSGSPGTYNLMMESGVTPIGLLVAGSRVVDLQAAALADSIVPTNPAPVTATFSSAASSITVSSGAGIQAGQVVNGPGIVPGTTVATSYTLGSTTVPLSTNTTAAGTNVVVSFSVQLPLPRFLRLNYVVSNGPFTAGTLIAGIFADPIDAIVHYRPGFSQPY